MKITRVIFTIGFGLAALVILVRSLPAYSVVKDNSPLKTNEPEVLGTPDTPENDDTVVSTDQTKYHFAWILAKPENMSLVSNLDDKETASELKEKHECSSLVNAGFYNKDNKAIGLLITDGEPVSDYQENALFDGILSVNEFDTPRITTEVPKDKLRLAVQSGPLLQVNDSKLELDLKRDKNARRIVAAVTGDNELMFIVFYDSNAVFSGPLLVDLPSLVSDFEKDNNINLADAINLDGGSASAFLTEAVNLTEISPIGSFFCIK